MRRRSRTTFLFALSRDQVFDSRSSCTVRPGSSRFYSLFREIRSSTEQEVREAADRAEVSIRSFARSGLRRCGCQHIDRSLIVSIRSFARSGLRRDVLYSTDMAARFYSLFREIRSSTPCISTGWWGVLGFLFALSRDQVFDGSLAGSASGPISFYSLFREIRSSTDRPSRSGDGASFYSLFREIRSSTPAVETCRRPGAMLPDRTYPLLRTS